jgi:hypothetical protein
MSKIAKALVAGAGALGIVLAQLLQAGNVIPDRYAQYATLVLGVLTALGVYRVPNTAPGAHEADDTGAGELGLVLVVCEIVLCVVAVIALVIWIKAHG